MTPCPEMIAARVAAEALLSSPLTAAVETMPTGYASTCEVGLKGGLAKRWVEYFERWPRESDSGVIFVRMFRLWFVEWCFSTEISVRQATRIVYDLTG